MLLRRELGYSSDVSGGHNATARAHDLGSQHVLRGQGGGVRSVRRSCCGARTCACTRAFPCRANGRDEVRSRSCCTCSVGLRIGGDELRTQHALQLGVIAL
jgi:hypothetical protein